MQQLPHPVGLQIRNQLLLARLGSQQEIASVQVENVILVCTG